MGCPSSSPRATTRGELHCSGVCELRLTYSGVHPGSTLISTAKNVDSELTSECLINDDHACIGWGGGELWVRPFQVLAYCSPNRR